MPEKATREQEKKLLKAEFILVSAFNLTTFCPT
jgi:hypothetical protein